MWLDASTGISGSSARTAQWIWLAAAYALCFRVANSWWAAVSQRSYSDNGIIDLAAIVTIALLPRYWHSSPPFTQRYRVGGVVALFLSSLLTAGAIYFHFLRIYWIGFLAMVAGIIWACGGIACLKHWRPLLLFSLALLPGLPAEIFNSTTAWLKMLISQVFLRLLSMFIPIAVHGAVFSVRGQSFYIADACCGLSMLSGFVFLILLLQAYTRVRLGSLALLLIAALVTAVVLNGVRIGITALLAYHYSQPVALQWHSNLEYALFPLGMLLLWQIHVRLKQA